MSVCQSTCALRGHYATLGRPTDVHPRCCTCIRSILSGGVRWHNSGERTAVLNSIECHRKDCLLDKSAATRPHLAGFEATSLDASAMQSWVQAGRPGIEVAARPNPAVPGGVMPAHHHQRPWALSSSFCRHQRLHHPEDLYSIGRLRFLCRWPMTTVYPALWDSLTWTLDSSNDYTEDIFVCLKPRRTCDSLFLMHRV